MACGCEHSGVETCSQCEFEPFVRNNYFTGKLMTAADFIDEQTYHREKQRHHNARLHGSGVVCGLRVHEHPTADCRKRYVIVEPGSAIDCCGHEILVPDAETVDVAQHPAVLEKTNDGALHTLQVVACYRECPTEDVPVLYDDCGCDDTQCAANRILESYAFDILVDPPLTDGLGGAAALGAFVTSNAHGAIGWIQASAAGKVAILDPGDGTTTAGAGQRAFILDVAHRSLITVDLPAKARAIAMARDGGHVFVVVDPFGGQAECRVLVFDAVDGKEVPPGAPRTVPGTSSTTALSAATTTDPDRVLAVLDGAGAKLYPWKADSSTVIVDSPAPAVTFSQGGSLVAAEDGSSLYAVDTTSIVQVLDMTVGSPAPTPLTGLPAGRTPKAIAAFMLGTTEMLAVGSGSSKTVDLVDPSGTVGVVTVNVAQPPVYLGVTGTAAAPWINVYEEQAGHGYVQAIGLDAATPSSPPAVTAPRAAGDGPARVLVVHAHGQASVVDPGQFADSDCADLLEKQDSCPGCDAPECIVLATIAGYRPGSSLLDMPAEADDLANAIARIDLRAGRRTLASTATLQAWLECLQLKGGVPGPKGDQGTKGDKGDPGDPGDPGAGLTGVEVTTGECGTQATATIDNGVLKLTIPRGCDGEDGGAGLVEVTIETGECDTPASATLENGHLKIVIPGCCTPDLTKICGINWVHAGDMLPGEIGERLVVAFTDTIVAPDVDRELPNIFIVEMQSERDDNDDLDCWCQLRGKYQLLTVPDCTVEKAEDAAAGGPVTGIGFLPERGFRLGTYRVRVHGDLIQDERHRRAIDANHLPPWKPSAADPTGDCIEGGTFYSYFTVKG